MCKELHKICEYANMLGINLNLTHKMVEELEKTFDKFKESGFEDYYKEQLQTWIETHLPELFTLFVKQVYFGLTDDGYFCAYIPDSWSDIQFDTGANYGQFDYGRLILRFNADGSGVIDNTGRYDAASAAAINKRLDRMEHTLYTRLGLGGD
jgi:hypothetical protein